MISEEHAEQSNGKADSSSIQIARPAPSEVRGYGDVGRKARSGSSRRSTRRTNAEEKQVCDFCGARFEDLQITFRGNGRRKYCSRACQKRAGQGRKTVRLAMPQSKRYNARLKFSSPLYFS